MIQTAIVTLIVVCSAGYAAWSLMPGAARRALARKLLAWPLPERLGAGLRRHADGAAGCACDGCDRSAQPAAQPRAGITAPITFHPRPQR